MAQATTSQTDIPDDQVDVVEAIARASVPPPTSVTRIRQPNGLWTITATFSATTPAVAAGAATALAAATPKPAPASAAANRGRFAIDSLHPASSAMLDAATTILGGAPLFWGRYFYAPGQVDSSGQRNTGHYSAAENALLRANKVRILPIARQTGHVGRDTATGADDAAKNVAALFEVFSPGYLHGADPNVLLFLDSEGDPSLSADYYVGWADAVVKTADQVSNGTVRMLPAVYGSAGDRTTWASLADALSRGASCAGLWTASWGPVTNPNPPAPRDWSDAATQPAGTKLDTPVLAWQYSDKGNGFDADQTNPAHDDVLFDRLIMPPG